MRLKAVWENYHVIISNIPENKTLSVGDISYTFEALLSNKYEGASLTWTSSNSTVARMETYGLLQLKTPGETVITVTAAKTPFAPQTHSFTLTVTEAEYDNVFTFAEGIDIDDEEVKRHALILMNRYYKYNSSLKSVINGTNPDCNTCIFAFEGLGDPSLKLLDQKDNYELPENQISSVHQQWRYMAMMIVTKGKEIVYVTRRSSTLPDQATSYSYSTTNREKGPTTLKEHIYDYKTGVHFGSYLALVPSDDDRIAWYRNDGVFVCSGSQGTNLHAGTGKASPSNANSTGCQLIHYKDYISFGKAVGFLKDSDEETLNDLTTTGSSLGTNLGNLTGANATNSNPHYNYVEVKYILDRTYDETNGFYSDPKRFEEYAKELSNIEMSSSSTSEDIQKSEDLQRYLSYYDNIDESYKTGIFYPISKQCDISVCETH